MRQEAELFLLFLLALPVAGEGRLVELRPAFLVEVGQVLAAVFGVLFEIIIGAMGDSL